MIIEKNPKYESLDYDEIENEIAEEDMKNCSSSLIIFKNVFQWVMTGLIGICTAVVGLFMELGMKWITFIRIYITYNFISKYPDSFWIPFAVYVLLGMTLGMFASFFVIIVEPVAGGSGIPEIKSYLNGIKVPRILRFKTLVAKFFGTIFSVGSGLAVGPEGPMVHLGAIIAAGLSQVKSTTFKTINIKYLSFFRNDREKRDFVNGGAAAGMASALGTPIGGTLFTLEEGASFWNQNLTWRTFFCSMTAAFCINFLLSGFEYGSWGALSELGLVNFGSFSTQSKYGYTIIHVPFFLLLGVIGGLLGALFNFLNKLITVFRTLLVSLVTSVLSFVYTYYIHECFELDVKDVESDDNQVILMHFFCPRNYYNDMGIIFLNNQQDAVKQLFHNNGHFSFTTLSFFFVTYFFLSCWTFGLSIPSGLFVPSLLTGAAMGRLMGTILETVSGMNINPGTFALIGSASLLGGKTRTTISLTVILLESTNNITYGLPLMTTLMVSKWVADRFNNSIYENQIHIRNIPYLEWELDHNAKHLKANDIMNSPVITFSEVERVSFIYQTLENTTHNGFPIIDENLMFVGLILKSQLLTILEILSNTKPEYGESPLRKLTNSNFLDSYPRFSEINNIFLTQSQMNLSLDLSPYISRNLVAVKKEASISRVFVFFRSLGLRHLVVTDKKNVVVGIITRKDIAHAKKKINSELSLV